MNVKRIMATVMPMLYAPIQRELTPAMFVMLDMNPMLLEVNVSTQLLLVTLILLMHGETFITRHMVG